MKRILSIFLFFTIVVVNAQSNSDPYENTSIIKLKTLSADIALGLDVFDIIHLSCRNHATSEEIIVNSLAIGWLTENNYEFEVLVEDLKQKIDIENTYMNSVRSQRDGDEWYAIYRTYDEIQVKLAEIADNNEIASLVDLGDSYEGRAINGIKLSTGADDKPAVFFNGCQHAREWISPMATTFLAEQLSQNYLTDDFTTTILNLVDVYIIPIVNPDGYVYSHTSERYWRKNRQPNGSSCVGTDLNRNWDADWNGGESTSTSACSDIYVGTEAFSAVEAMVVKNYMESIPNLVGHIDIHSYSALVLGPWGYSNNESPDHAEVVSLGNTMNDAITNTNNYPFTFGVGDADGAIYLASGTMPDWSYDDLGALGYTFELRPNSSSGGGFELPEAQIMDACEENYNGAFEMIKWAADVQSGCMDFNACNYDATATVDDGSCTEFDECGDCGGNGPISGYDCAGNCITGELLTIQMSDSYGDGWNGNDLLINGMSFTINSGSSNSAEMCYDSESCIIVSCNGGSWQEEVSWTILNSSGNELLSGGAPFEGEFGNCYDEISGCTDALAINYNAFATIDDNSCEYSNTDEQVINLPLGWFIFSSYIQPQFPDIMTVINPISSSTIIVKDIEGNAYLPNWEWDAIGDITMGEAYLIKLSQTEDLTISGTKIIPEDFVINLSEGWSLLGYLRDSPASLITMLTPINEHIVIVKTFDGTAYLPDWGYNGIGDMTPGMGYQIKVDSDVSFTYSPN